MLEKTWAINLLAEIDAREVDEQELLTYYDWLNLMLGRKKFIVELYVFSNFYSNFQLIFGKL